MEAVLGKKIVDAYYKQKASKSYYLGCSTGGRQGIQSALRFPDDFDGIVAGSPATDWQHLMGWSGMLGRYLGAPNPQNSPSFVPATLWPTISNEILKQCDGLDGVVDSIITEPDQCAFRPEALLCTGSNSSSCLTAAQVAAVRKVYEPVFGTQGELLYPRYDPGAEANGTFSALLSGNFFPFTSVGFHYDLEALSNLSRRIGNTSLFSMTPASDSTIIASLTLNLAIQLILEAFRHGMVICLTFETVVEK